MSVAIKILNVAIYVQIESFTGIVLWACSSLHVMDKTCLWVDDAQVRVNCFEEHQRLFVSSVYLYVLHSLNRHTVITDEYMYKYETSVDVKLYLFDSYQIQD